MRPLAALVLFIACVTAAGLLDAAPQQTQPAFEVASIKPDVGASPGSRYSFYPGFKAESATLKDLLMLAYDVREFQISGGPDWVNSDRYNIEAKADAKPAYDQKWMAGQKQRLQRLLQERFGLVMHRETKELTIYHLTVAKGGLKLQPLKEGSCIPFDPNNPTPPPGKTPMDYCGSGGFTARGRYQASSASMADLAMAFSLLTSRTVVDKTEVTGVFPVHLTFVPDDSMMRVFGPPGDAGNAASAADAGPSIFTALQEQLGLRLQSGKGPVGVLVIDHVEKPSEN
jgi:uncharacterized protein (TIGR03435 family)